MLKQSLKILALAVCLITLIEVVSASVGGSQDVKVNILPEFLLVNSPANSKVYNNSLIDVNVTLDVTGLKVDFIKWSFDKQTWKILCTDCNEYGMFKKKNRAFKEGDSEIEFRLMNYGNKILQEKTVKFSVDTKLPVILKTQPSTGSASNGDEFLVKYSEDNLKEVTLYYGTDKITKTNKECLAGKKKECSFNADLSKYNYKWVEYYFSVSDFASTVVSTKAKVFVDLNNPVLNINSPIDGNYNSRTIAFNITSDEYSTIEYKDLKERNPAWKKLCTNCIQFGMDKKKTVSLTNGAHELLIRAIDSAGNIDSKQVTLNIKSKGFLF